MRIRVPVETPAGMETSRSWRTRVRPSPEQSLQGVTMTVPYPWQPGQGEEVITCPSRVRVMRWTLPTPLHWEQVTGSVPGAQQEPSQAVQVT